MPVPSAASIDYPARVSLARAATPLQPLDRLSGLVGGPRIWVKRDDLTGFGLSGNKVRKLEFCIGDALAQGCDTLITCGGVQSNHCRATAVAARQLGLDVHLVLRQDSPAVADGNLFIDRLLGADITLLQRGEWAARLDATCAALAADCARRGRKAYTMPVGASDEVGLWGYIAAAGELAEDFAGHGIAPGHIVCATGSGGTQGGLSLGVLLRLISTAQRLPFGHADRGAKRLCGVRCPLSAQAESRRRAGRCDAGEDPDHPRPYRPLRRGRHAGQGTGPEERQAACDSLSY